MCKPMVWLLLVALVVLLFSLASASVTFTPPDTNQVQLASITLNAGRGAGNAAGTAALASGMMRRASYFALTAVRMDNVVRDFGAPTLKLASPSPNFDLYSYTFSGCPQPQRSGQD